MDDALRSALDVLRGRVDAKARELAELKKTVNLLAKEAGGEPPYPEAENNNGPTAVMRADLYYGKSPVVAAREYLEMRGRAVPLEEIYQGLISGGFDFVAQGWKDEKQWLRFLGISLGKNTAIFHRLPNGTIGLVKFYPAVAEKKRRISLKPSDAEGDENEAETEEEAAGMDSE